MSVFNPILRAGPWRFGSLTNGEFRDRPDTLDNEFLPVNLANVGWPDQPFVMLGTKRKLFAADPEYVEVALGETVILGNDDGDLGPFISLEFYYQATSDFDVTFNWTDSGIPALIGGPIYFNTSSYFYDTIEGDEFGGDFQTTDDPSGRYDITLPKSRLGKFGASINAVLYGGTVTARLS